jgi:mRNA interferase MazF
MITSKNTKDSSAISITNEDFAKGRLPQDSNVRPNRLFTADTNIIMRAAGRLSPEKIDEVVAEIVRIVSNGGD